MFLLITILSFSTSRDQDVYSVEVCFDSYYQGIYCFVDIEGTSFQFEDIEPMAMEKYDLTDGGYQGRMFTVVYRVEISVYEEDEGEDEDEDDEEEDEKEDDVEQYEYQEKIIVDLEIIG